VIALKKQDEHGSDEVGGGVVSWSLSVSAGSLLSEKASKKTKSRPNEMQTERRRMSREPWLRWRKQSED
jgi:hypothetical protein